MNKQINNSHSEKKPQITILVTEDNIKIFRYLELILMKKNYNVIHANNGLEAIKFVEEEVIDLILMDIKMPIMDGITACRIIKKNNPSIPIIMQSGYIDKEVHKQALDAGSKAIVIKPYSRLELFEIIEQQLGRAIDNL